MMMRRATGFTLLELLMFIVIVSIGVAGILSALNITAQHSADPMIHKQSLSIAEALMEEVSLAKFTYCDPADPNAETATNPSECTAVPGPKSSPGSEHLSFDNVINYAGVTIDPGISGYSATIQVTPEALDDIPATESLHIVVRVTHGNETLRLDGFRTRYAPNLMP